MLDQMDAAGWMEELEELLDVFIQYEEYFGFQEDNGEIKSNWEWEAVKQWIETGRLPLHSIVLSTVEIKPWEIVPELRKWWTDICSDFNTDAGDYGELNTMSGKNGVWKVIWGLMGALVCILDEPLWEDESWGTHTITDDQRLALADWNVLLTWVKDTLVCAFTEGSFKKKAPKRKAESDAGPSEHRTRARTAAAALESSAKSKGKAAKSKGKGKGGKGKN
jgi:hypothetical protein